jgi:DNA-binding FadR family transcriptional regulator
VRIQCWAFAVPYLRREPDLKGRLWSGHSALVDAVDQSNDTAAHQIIADYHDHSLQLLEKLMQDG